MALTGKLTKKLVENLSAGRYGDGGGLYLVVDPSGTRRWILRVVVKGQRYAQGALLRTDFGLGGADVVTLNQACERGLEYPISRLAAEAISQMRRDLVSGAGLSKRLIGFEIYTPENI